MNNLKRVLSLALSGVMLVGMMAVSAGAVNGKDFTDADEITHTEAVNTLVTLNVINGKDDGSHYDPEGTLTRAEMAKLIVYVLNGGKEPVLSTKATPTYSDIKGHWAEKYIEYCSNLKIVAGQGDGTFNPGGTLTASQAAKMMLTAMNYNSDVFTFTGPDWELNVNSEANKAGLYEELDGLDASAEISRDDAAQLVYNGIQAQTMKRTWSQERTDLSIRETYDLTGPSLFEDKFNGTVYEGIMTGSGYYTLDANVTINSVANSRTSGSKDTHGVLAEKQNGKTILSSGTLSASNVSFKWADHDLTSLVGQRVKVLLGKNDAVYGVYAVADENTVDVKTTTNKVSLSDGKIKVGDTKYDYKATAIVYVDGAAAQTVAATSGYIASSAVKKADNIRLISNNGDEEIDVILIDTVAVAKVAYVGTTDFNVTKTAGSRTVATSGAANLNTYSKASQKLADVNVYEDMEKNDYAVLSEDNYTKRDVVTKIDKEEGTITGTKTGQWQIDGKWFKPYEGYTGMDVLGNGDTLEYVAINGIVYFAEKTTANTVTDIAAIITVGKNTGTSSTVAGATLEAKLLFPDGSKKTVTVSKLGNVEVKTTNVDAGTDFTELDGSTTGTALAIASELIGDIVTYKVDNDGKYELTAIPNDSTTKAAIANFDRSLDNADGKKYVASTKSIAGYTLADDAVVFVINSGTADTPAAANDGKVFSGKEIKRLAADFGDTNSSISATPGLVSTRNGIQEVAVAVLSTSAAIPTLTGAGTSYGYLTAGTYRTTEDGVDYNVFTYWDGTEEVTAKEKSTTSKISFGAGQVIGFDTLADGKIKNVALVGATGKVSGYNADKNEVQLQEIAGSTFKITNDTTVIYVDTDAGEGRTGGGISLANDFDDNGTYDENNVLYIVTPATNEVELLVVDVNNKYDGTSKATKSGTASALLNQTGAAGVIAEFKYYDVVEITDAVTLTKPLTVPAGKTLVLDALLTTGANTLTVNGSLTLKNGATLATGGIAVAKDGSVTVEAGTVDNASLITGTAGATITFKKDVIVTASATLYYVSTADATADALGTLAADATYEYKTFTEAAGSTSVTGWLKK